MTNRSRARIASAAVLCAAAVAVTGCAQLGIDNPISGATTSAAAREGTAGNSEAAADNPDATTSATGSASATAADPTGATVDLTDQEGFSDRHANGATLHVTSITRTSTGYTVGVRVVNGYTKAIRLSTEYTHNDPTIQLYDDTGVRYRFRNPETNSPLWVKSGAEMEGEFVFLGEPAESATVLSLKTNTSANEIFDPLDKYQRGDSTINPQFYVEKIPVP